MSIGMYATPSEWGNVGNGYADYWQSQRERDFSDPPPPRKKKQKATKPPKKAKRTRKVAAKQKVETPAYTPIPAKRVLSLPSILVAGVQSILKSS